MKKTLSILLAVILMFSAVSVMAFAEDEATEGTATDLVSIVFYINADEIGGETNFHEIQVVPGKNFTERLVAGEEAIGDPEKLPEDGIKYIFKGWERYTLKDGAYEGNGTCYSASTIPVVKDGDAVDGKVYYVAVFAEEEIKESQTFWQFVQSIFARINAIFEYFAKVFEGVFDF